MLHQIKHCLLFPWKLRLLSRRRQILFVTVTVAALITTLLAGFDIKSLQGQGTRFPLIWFLLTTWLPTVLTSFLLTKRVHARSRQWFPLGKETSLPAVPTTFPPTKMAHANYWQWLPLCKKTWLPAVLGASALRVSLLLITIVNPGGQPPSTKLLW